MLLEWINQWIYSIPRNQQANYYCRNLIPKLCLPVELFRKGIHNDQVQRPDSSADWHPGSPPFSHLFILCSLSSVSPNWASSHTFSPCLIRRDLAAFASLWPSMCIWMEHVPKRRGSRGLDGLFEWAPLLGTQSCAVQQEKNMSSLC